jgi:hypothetical protein
MIITAYFLGWIESGTIATACKISCHRWLKLSITAGVFVDIK